MASGKKTGHDLASVLTNPECYPHAVKQCQLIETHISWVILTGFYAYKIKKPVNLGFLDFSTLDKRHHYCEEELRLNQRLAPELYLGVVAITENAGEITVDGQGTAVEYAVRMRQFDQSSQLDEMLGAGKLKLRHIEAIADKVATFHDDINIAKAEDQYGSPDEIWQAIANTFESFKSNINEPALLSDLQQLEEWCEHFFSENRAFIAARKSQGFIRECHGDLHLRNIAWQDNAALIFDCIEFSPKLRWNDVISEVAFLVMDLEERKAPDLAHCFLNRYLERTGDYEGMRVFRFYLVYRAVVRGMVAALRLRQTGLSSSELKLNRQETQQYVALALGYIKKFCSSLLITHGFSGSGKTKNTEEIVNQLGALRIRSDVERKRLFQLPVNNSAKAAIEAGIYSAEASAKTYQHLLLLAENIIAYGYILIVDATFNEKTQRDAFRGLAKHKNIPFYILQFKASPETLKKRLAQRYGDASDADASILEHQLNTWIPPDLENETNIIVIDTEKPTPMAEVIKRLTSTLSSANRD